MKIQPPKGIRDFYPKEMAWRNYIVDAWRKVSERNGFEQVDGPIFESLDLYKVKSGDGIVSELFHFTDRGDRPLAIRPEFTPTLARMVAAQANSLPKPIKWFCTPNLCRAEAPGRGRLREFLQWNCDILGLDGPIADAECIFTCVDLLMELGLKAADCRVKISHRTAASTILQSLGVPSDKIIDAYNLLDSKAKVSPQEFATECAKLSISETGIATLEAALARTFPISDLQGLQTLVGPSVDLTTLKGLQEQLTAFGIADWCEFDLSIVRGLAYYTGTVFEVHESSGNERALAGGGRYDQLISLFDGPATPAVGFGMGDVVLSNVLTDKGLVPKSFQPAPDVFVFAGSDATAAEVPAIVAALRRAGLHTRMSYKTTRNVGKLLKDASTTGAKLAVFTDDAATPGTFNVKNLATGTQTQATLEDIIKQAKA
jgi:histidyl-tRNA synthetase